MGCLYLLDGNFNNLGKLYVNILTINSIETIDIKKKLINLKLFSLTCYDCTIMYNQLIELIMLLLNIMPNINEFYLNILIKHQIMLVNDNHNHIKNHMINQLLNLKKLDINIRYENNLLFIIDEQKIIKKKEI